MKNFHMSLIVSIVCLMTTVQAQNNLLNGPEGIAYDKGTKSYFVTNASDGKIIQIDSLGNHSIFYQGLSVPMGLHLVGDSLLVSSNDPSTISCIQITSGSLLGEITISESQSMAHMDYDGRTHSLYVIGQQGQVFKIDVPSLTYEEFVPVGGGLANGSQTCVVDTTNNCLLIFGWPTTFVREVDLNDPTLVQNLINPQCGQYIDCIRGPQGSIYVASWQGHIIHKFQPDCSSLPEVFATGFNKPAGMVYNPDEDAIAVCNFGGNSIDFITLNTTDVDNNTGYLKTELKLYPNPVKKMLHLKYCLPEPSRVSVAIKTTEGKIVHTQSAVMFPSGENKLTINCTDYSPGIYLVTLIINDNETVTRKFIKN